MRWLIDQIESSGEVDEYLLGDEQGPPVVVPLAEAPPTPERAVAATEGVTVTMIPEGAADEAARMFERDTDPALTVGYDGYWTCNNA